MEGAFVIHVVEKESYTSQHLVPISITLPSLQDQSIRVKPTLLGLSRYNTAFARSKEIKDWWDVHPLPPKIPVEFSDSKVHGRTGAWGYARVIGSTIDAIPTGADLFGFLPIGTLPVDIRLDAAESVQSHWVGSSSYQGKTANLYNRYFVFPATKAALNEAEKQSRAYDTLMQMHVETAYNLSRCTFAWDRPAIHPFTGKEFGAGNADISDAVVIIMPAGGKMALALAQQFIAGGRPAEFQPRRVIGVGSRSSRALAQKSRFYDQLLDYTDVEGDLMAKLGVHGNITKVVICDAGSRDGAAEKWETALKTHFEDVLPVIMASNEPRHAKAANGAAKAEDVVRVDASMLRDRALESEGEKAYFDAFLEEWEVFKDNGGVRGLDIEWRSGMKEVGKAWEKLCKGEVGPDLGLVFEI